MLELYMTTYTERFKSKARPKINFQTDEDSKRENSLSIIKKCTKVADTEMSELNNKIKCNLLFQVT